MHTHTHMHVHTHIQCMHAHAAHNACMHMQSHIHTHACTCSHTCTHINASVHGVDTWNRYKDWNSRLRIFSPKKQLSRRLTMGEKRSSPDSSALNLQTKKTEAKQSSTKQFRHVWLFVCNDEFGFLHHRALVRIQHSGLQQTQADPSEDQNTKRWRGEEKILQARSVQGRPLTEVLCS